MNRVFRPAVLLSALVLLPSCEDGKGLSGLAEPAQQAAAAQEPQVVIKDVERPDIFETKELALWDGRPSLGGIWVAHPDVKEPERAILRNETNGQTVAAALFRRERNNPGPRIQVSSDAAAALSILAGQPTEMSIVAVRQEEVIIEPAPLPISEEEIGAEAATEEVTDNAGAPETSGTSDDGAETAAVAAGAAVAVDAPKKPNFLERLFARKKPAGDVAEEADTAAIDASAPPAVETAPLDPVTAGAAAAIAQAEAEDKPAPRPAAPTASALKNPYVQVGLFSVEENASAAATSLRQAGMVPTVKQQEVNGKTFWRVSVGPVSTTADQAAILAQVKRLGYSDAFLAPN